MGSICTDYQLLISKDLVVKTIIKALVLIRIYSNQPISLTKHMKSESN